jgi:hypothetical protein
MGMVNNILLKLILEEKWPNYSEFWTMCMMGELIHSFGPIDQNGWMKVNLTPNFVRKLYNFNYKV